MTEMKENMLYQLHDAKMDMLKGLNCLTDLHSPSFQDVQSMGILSRAIKDLQEATNMVHALGGEDAASMADHVKK